ncbi:MAG: MOSC domain-containing protein [Chloroflexi bacterium]|nr:MOSC domain-containing protein [Chloroflexota bacterium]
MTPVIGQQLATIRRLYVYPVKSMRGVEMAEAHVGLNGIYGDRRYAFVQKQLAASDNFPWMTGREKPRMILYTPRFTRTLRRDDTDPPVRVSTPDHDDFAVDDEQLRTRLEAEHRGELFLIKNARGNYDSQHVSLFSLLTLRALELESDSPIDHRQFRANLYVEPSDGMPFAEDDWVGGIVQIGSAVIAITKRDKRCMMINLDPESAVQHPEVLRTVVRRHDERVGIYGNVLTPGVIRAGDTVSVLAMAGDTGREDD